MLQKKLRGTTIVLLANKNNRKSRYKARRLTYADFFKKTVRCDIISSLTKKHTNLEKRDGIHKRIPGDLTDLVFHVTLKQPPQADPPKKGG